jgi:hypothetical protein
MILAFAKSSHGVVTLVISTVHATCGAGSPAGSTIRRSSPVTRSQAVPCKNEIISGCINLIWPMRRVFPQNLDVKAASKGCVFKRALS